MKKKKLLALLLTLTLICSVAVFTPAIPTAVAEKATVRLLPTDDSYISFQSGSEDECFGDKTTLELGYYPDNPLPVDTGYTGSSRGELYYARDIFLRFDLCGIDTGTISSAVIKLTVSKMRNLKDTASSSTVTSTTIAAYAFDGDWSESTVTKSNAPAVAAEDFAAVSNVLNFSNAGEGDVVEIDLTSYIRQNPAAAYSFRIKAAGAGFDFYSKETGTPSYRPVLEIEYDGQLAPSVYGKAFISDDTYADGDAAADDLSAAEELVVASDQGDGAAKRTRNSYIKFSVPETKADVIYDSFRLVLRGKSLANSDQTITLAPIASDVDFSEINWENLPEADGDAAAEFTLSQSVANDVALRYYSIDLTDYINSTPSENGSYAFALTADTAVSYFYSLEYENELYRPYTEYIYREAASLTLHFSDANGNDIAPPKSLTLPVGEAYTPEYSLSLDDGWFFSTSATEAKNAFPYTVKEGRNDVYLVYENKSISGCEEVSVTTVQYEAPELPDEITVYFGDGSSESFPVSWSSVSEESYAVSGEFTVVGTLQGIEYENVCASVKVIGITGVSVPTLSTAPGSYPLLPETLDVNLENGETHAMLVQWDEIEESAYEATGSLVASGTLVLSGMRVQMTVLVEDGDLDDRAAVADAYTEKSSPNSSFNTEELKVSGVNGAGRANTDRKTFLRFEGGNFGEPYFDNDRNAEIDSIVSSKVRLYFNKIDNDATATYKIYGILPEYDNWIEDEITWNNSEDITENSVYLYSVSVKHSSFEASWIDFDVTSFVREHRDEEYLSFYVESDTCAAYIASRENGSDALSPVLQTSSYIPDAAVTLRYVAEIDGETVDIAEATDLTGKLEHPYTYQSAIPNPIYFPDADSDGIYYYNFVTSPNPPSEEESDPKLHLDSLTDGYNEIQAQYTRREITSIEPVTAETFRGTKPELPDSVTAYLDNGTPVTEAVEWRWDEVDFRAYSTVGVFTLYGSVEYTNIPAEAEITVYNAYYDEGAAQNSNEFDLDADTAYRLTFTLNNTDSLSDALSDIDIVTNDSRQLAYDMTAEDFMDYLASFEEGETVEVFFTTPAEGASMTLVLPDCVSYMIDARLRTVLGRGGDMTLHYMYNDEEIYSSPINAAYGSTFTLSEEYLTILDGAYKVNGVDSSKSDIASLTDTVVLDTDGLNAYLLCYYCKVFTFSTSVENVADALLNSYTRSTATLFNGTDTDKTATVIVAKYSEDGMLVGLEHEALVIPALSENAVTKTVNVPVDGNYTTILLWDEISGLTPFTSKVDSRNPTGKSSKPETGDLILIPTLGRSVTASAEQSGNEAVHMLTRDLTTRWSAQVEDESSPVYADIYLGGLYDLHTIGLAFYNGASRNSRFAVSVSEDGEDWIQIISPRYSSGKTASTEYYSFDTITAAYVRVSGYGWKANEITDEGLVETKGDWFSVTAFEAYGSLNDATEIRYDEITDFEGLAGTTLTTSVSSKAKNWGANALSEATYTNYTPLTGTALYADITSTPDGVGFEEGNTALRLYDNVDRDGDASTGAGSIGAFHKLSLTSERYSIRFKWYVPNVIDGETYNAQWSGLAISAGQVGGGADTSHPVALQLRLSPSGKNKMGFNIIRSIVYNDGDQESLLGSSCSFNANCVWDVILDVDSEANTVIITVSDGSRTESAYVGYALYDNERTLSQTWSNSSVNYIMFNTGAGGKCEMYVDDFTVSYIPTSSEDEGSVTYSQDFDGFAENTSVRGDDGSGISSALIKETGQAYTASYGTMLDVDFEKSSMTGGNALHLYDFVGRTESSSKGAGGVFAYVDLGDLSTENVTKIKFDMYAPTYGEYSGFALANGHNFGGDDQENPLALQVRFSPQSSGMQFNQNSSIQYNKASSYTALVGTGNNRLSYGAVWSFELSVNPYLGNVTVKVTDGSIVSSKTVTMPTTTTESSTWTADWSKTPINTLIFNTGAGTSAEIYIDNIEVIDTGEVQESLSAVNGVIRLEAPNSSGQGYYIVHGTSAGSSFSIKSSTNPYYTRFVERKGLADPNCVSFEILGMPGYYMYADSNWKVTIQKYSDTEEFRRNATFIKTSSISNEGSTAFSYKLYRNNELLLCNSSNSLGIIKNPEGGNKKYCTFHLRDESAAYVSDSFSGTSISSQWYKGYPWYANYHNHSAVARDENIVVSGGRVLLEATKVASDNWIKNSSGSTGYNDSINNNKWKKYCAYTGVISINSKVYNKGSYIEGSFKQPNSPRGYWTAFWLNGRDSWPPETDMFEYLSSKGTSTWYTATHGGTEGAGWQTSSAVGNLRTTYHTFTIDWGYNYMKMYVNGSLYFTAPDTSYQKNMYLILNTGIGAWESEPDSTTVWGEGLECKYIRSYQYY